MISAVFLLCPAQNEDIVERTCNFFFPQEIFFPRIKLNLTFNEQIEILSPYSGWDGIQHKALSLVVLFSLPSPFLPARPLFLSLAITDHDSCRKGLFKSAQDTMKSQPESSKKKLYRRENTQQQALCELKLQTECQGRSFQVEDIWRKP